MNIKTSVKHLQINKTNNLIFAVVAVAAVVSVFSLISAKSLLSQSSYQRKVLNERNKAVKQLQANITAANTLKEQYEVFAKDNPNVLGGQGGATPGTGPNDGDNTRIVLDALPNQYDFPALISSIEKIFLANQLNLQSVGGTDTGGEDPAGGTSQETQSAQAPTIPFSVNILTDYARSIVAVQDFERSIRPIDVTNFSMNGSATNLTITMQANTYYQLPVSLKIEQREVSK